MEVVRAEGSDARLGVRTSAKLHQSDLLRVVHGPSNIRRDLEQKLDRLWAAGHVSVGELWSLYCRYPYLARLKNRQVLDEGIRFLDRRALDGLDLLGQGVSRSRGMTLAYFDRVRELRGCLADRRPGTTVRDVDKGLYVLGQ